MLSLCTLPQFILLMNQYVFAHSAVIKIRVCVWGGEFASCSLQNSNWEREQGGFFLSPREGQCCLWKGLSLYILTWAWLSFSLNADSTQKASL